MLFRAASEVIHFRFATENEIIPSEYRLIPTLASTKRDSIR